MTTTARHMVIHAAGLTDLSLSSVLLVFECTQGGKDAPIADDNRGCTELGRKQDRPVVP